MSAFEVFTWLAIAVLLAGSTAVFVWFLLDLGRAGNAVHGHGVRSDDQESVVALDERR